MKPNERLLGIPSMDFGVSSYKVNNKQLKTTSGQNNTTIKHTYDNLLHKCKYNIYIARTYICIDRQAINIA